jgi:hypothetical protein
MLIATNTLDNEARAKKNGINRVHRYAKPSETIVMGAAILAKGASFLEGTESQENITEYPD